MGFLFLLLFFCIELTAAQQVSPIEPYMNMLTEPSERRRLFDWWKEEPRRVAMIENRLERRALRERTPEQVATDLYDRVVTFRKELNKLRQNLANQKPQG